MAIDEESRHFVADVGRAIAILHGRLGQRDPRHLPQERAERSGRRHAVHPTHNPVRPDLDLDASRYGVQPTCSVASRPARDDRAELVARDRELGRRNHVAVGKVFDPGVQDKQLQGAIELVGQPGLGELDLAVHTAVSGVGE